MRRAISLAQKGCGYTNPNPLVGAVIVKDGKIILDTECNPLHGPRVEEIIKALENGETPEKQQYVDEEIFAAVKDVESVNADGKDYDVTVVDDKVIKGRAY